MSRVTWTETNLGDCIELLTGFPFKSALYSTNEGIPLLRGDNVAQGFLRWENAKRWVIKNGEDFSNFQLLKDDVILAMDRPWIEAGLKYAWVTDHDLPCLLVQRVARIRGKENVSTTFIRYIIASPSFTNYIKPIVTGVNIPHISAQQIKDFKFTLPPYSVQCKIASILSAYDDLIENNLRRIMVLEEMAQVIYREWFVHFRYPGHEGARMVESELGEIPEGWEVQPIGKIFETLGGGTPSTKKKEYWENPDVTWFTPTDLTHSGSMYVFESEKKISTVGLKNSAAKMFPAYSVMMTSRATIGVTSMNTKAACTNQGFITCIPNDRVSAYQIYFWILQNIEMVENIASGATYKEISRGEFREFLFLIADQETNNKFIEVIKPICDLIENLLKKNINLRQQRNLLLPRLISGNIEI